jgi:hypothetical protein
MKLVHALFGFFLHGDNIFSSSLQLLADNQPSKDPPPPSKKIKTDNIFIPNSRVVLIGQKY